MKHNVYASHIFHVYNPNMSVHLRSKYDFEFLHCWQRRVHDMFLFSDYYDCTITGLFDTHSFQPSLYFLFSLYEYVSQIPYIFLISRIKYLEMNCLHDIYIIFLAVITIVSDHVPIFYIVSDGIHFVILPTS